MVRTLKEKADKQKLEAGNTENTENKSDENNSNPDALPEAEFD